MVFNQYVLHFIKKPCNIQNLSNFDRLHSPTFVPYQPQVFYMLEKKIIYSGEYFFNLCCFEAFMDNV